MTYTASLELSKELYELSGWIGTHNFYWNGKAACDISAETIEWGLEHYNHNAFPAYDLGYLLRKLNTPKHTTLVGSLGGNSKRYSASYIPDELGKYDIEVMHRKSDTPENALCSLAIALFKAGVLTKGMA